MENKARVIAEYKGAYKVKNENGEFLAKVTGRQMFTALSREDYPAVGDWVLIDELPESQAVIREILPRQTIIKRKAIGEKGATQIIATNIDIAFVVQSVGRDYNLNRFERYFAIISDSGIKPVAILNKVDLISKEELAEKLVQIKNRFPDINVVATSIVENDGLNELKNYIEKDKTYCFLGSSGVGKSSLINKLIGGDTIKTENISSYSGRGKHITTGRQMYFLPARRRGEENGGILIDNPGMREVGMAGAGEGINDLFDEITRLSEKCKYTDCTHLHEAGCEVLAAVKFGKIAKDKYQNYLNLKKESEYYEMSEIEKKEKEKDFGKFIKRAKKSLKDYGHKK
jgi:ribosome biogenesis GTPase